MPDTVECSQCRRKLRLPGELMGRQLTCPNCGAVLAGNRKVSTPSNIQSVTVQSGTTNALVGEPLPAEAVEEEVGQWRKARTGLTLSLAAMLLMAASFGLNSCVIPGSLGLIGHSIDGGILMGFLILAQVMTPASMVLWLNGQVFNAMSPVRLGTRQFGMWSAVTTGFVLVLYMLLFGLSFTWGSESAIDSFLVVVAVLLLASLLMVFLYMPFLFFMRSVALCIGSAGQARSISNLTVLWATLLGLAMLGLILAILGMLDLGPQWEADSGLVLACGYVWGVLRLVFIIWSGIAIFLLRSSLVRYIDSEENKFRPGEEVVEKKAPSRKWFG